MFASVRNVPAVVIAVAVVLACHGVGAGSAAARPLPEAAPAAQVAVSAVYTVGDQRGWSFNVANWSMGKRFRAGDVLVFKYNAAAHDVAAVNAAAYDSCSAPRGTKIMRSGNDRVTLRRGTNYFICTFPGHCQSGMKLAVIAA